MKDKIVTMVMTMNIMLDLCALALALSECARERFRSDKVLVSVLLDFLEFKVLDFPISTDELLLMTLDGFPDNTTFSGG